MRAQRIRVRNAWVRYEHSGEGKSDLSTKRSVPMTDRLAAELKRWRLRRSSAMTKTSSSPIPSSASNWTGRKSHAGSRLPASRPACAKSASRIFGTRSRPRSPQPACRCAPSRSTLATPTSRRRRSTRTTRHRHARCRSSTRRLDCPNGRTGGVRPQSSALRCAAFDGARVLIPLRLGSTAAFAGAGGHKRGDIRLWLHADLAALSLSGKAAAAVRPAPAESWLSSCMERGSRRGRPLLGQRGRSGEPGELSSARAAS